MVGTIEYTPLRPMTRALGLLIVVATLLAGSTGVASSQPVAGQDTGAGARVFDAKGCEKCHAIQGVGGKIGPDLSRISRPHSFYDLAAAMWNHLPRMAARMKELGIARPKLDAEEAKNLANFLYTLGYFERPGKSESGKRLFTAKRCVECHTSGPGPSIEGLKQFSSPIYAAAAMWNHGPQMAEVMKAKGIERPTFTGEELRDLIAYLSPITSAPAAGLLELPGNSERGRLLFAEKQCVQCHSVEGAGGSVGPSLTDRNVRRSPLEFAATIWNKAPAMTKAMAARNIAIPQLKPEDMADLVAYLYSAGYFARGASPNRGWMVLSSKGCLVCHGVFGERGKTASDLTAAKGVGSPAGLLADLWNHTTVPAPAPGGGKTPWPTFTGQEMADLTALLQGIRRPQ